MFILISAGSWNFPKTTTLQCVKCSEGGWNVGNENMCASSNKNVLKFDVCRGDSGGKKE